MTDDQNGARPDVIICNRKRKGGELCGTEIPFVKENFKVTKPEVPLISCICPECGMHKILDGETSKRLAEQFFKDEIATALAGSGKVLPADSHPAGGEDGVPPPPALNPSEDFAKRVVNTLIMLGYGVKSWEPRLASIKEFVMQVPTYQAPEGLRMLLHAMGIDPMKSQLVIQRIFQGVEMLRDQQVLGPQSGTGWGTLPYGAPPGAGSMVHAPPGNYPTVQMTPGGPVIVMPAQAQVVPARENNPDAVTIEEKLDEHGNVKSRVIRGPREKLMGGGQGADATLIQTIGMLKDLGLIREQKDEAPQIEKFMGGMVEIVKEMAKKNDELMNRYESSMGGTKRGRDEETRDEISGLREELKKVTDTQQQSVVNSVMNRLGSIEARLSGADPMPPGLTEEQARIIQEQRNVKAVLDTMERVGDRILEPMVELNKMQAKLQGLMNIRQMAYQDGVPPEYYLRAIAPASEPPSEEVASRVAEWRQRAEMVRQQQIAAAQAEAARQAAAQAPPASSPEPQQPSGDAPSKKEKRVRFAGMK